MQVRSSKSTNKVEQQMTPMIDVVFQLLIFFVMSFKVAELEGDFHMSMPLATHGGAAAGPLAPPLKLQLTADEQGNLAATALNQRQFEPGDWPSLQSHLLHVVGDAAGPGSIRNSVEIEIDCDYQLRYDHAIAAVTAISGTRSRSGEVVPLIEHVKFTPPRKGH